MTSWKRASDRSSAGAIMPIDKGAISSFRQLQRSVEKHINCVR